MVMRPDREPPEFPPTFHVDPASAALTLDYVEMLALALTFEHWALTERNVSGELRTSLIEWSADYREIALCCGLDWTAPEPESPLGLNAFIAQRQARSLSLYEWGRAELSELCRELRDQTRSRASPSAN
ncbi:MAG: hypothetical protein ACXWU1_06150 [Allosphingosinicella sp.]